MGWLVSFATAAFVWTVGADVHTFTKVAEKESASNLETVYVNGPALVVVEVSSTQSLGNSSSKGHAIVICPAGCNVSKLVFCDPSDRNKPLIAENARNISIFEISPGPVWSHQEVLPKTGAYDVILASCAEAAEALTITISGSNLSAHEGGWAMHYACIAVLYALLGLVWLRIRGELNATGGNLLSSDVSFTSFLLLGMACAGFTMHVLPQKCSLMGKLSAALTSVAIASLMMTFLKMTAVGFETFTTTNWYFEIAWYVFAVGHYIAVQPKSYDGTFAFDLWSTHTFNANYMLFPLFAGYAVFVVSCCFCLWRSAISLGQVARSFFSRVAAVVVIYTVLSMISAFCRAYDVPSADPETWKSHYVSEIVAQFTQAFGLAAALCVLKQGVPMHELAKGHAYGQIDEEIPEDGADDDDTAEQKSGISPVVYGAE